MVFTILELGNQIGMTISNNGDALPNDTLNRCASFFQCLHAPLAGRDLLAQICDHGSVGGQVFR
jgi:hypothetical protein